MNTSPTYILVRVGQFASKGGPYSHRVYRRERNGTYAILTRENGHHAEFEQGPLKDNYPVGISEGQARIAALDAWSKGVEHG